MTSPTNTPTPTTFDLRFTSTPRGARLARRLAAHSLDSWGYGYDSPVSQNASLVVAELAANAVTHGAVPGRDALLRLVLLPAEERLRIEVSDTRGERLPTTEAPNDCAETGRGLLIVAALAETWGVAPRAGAPGKTVWAVLTRRLR
ncbi:ATP-binding protein [Streptomyces sp. SID8379]|uniref:ATP-binding protein n=1 Tax=unclassified Streptomyces TaxID=2593676 RepID=UPI000380DB51|nr:MULTISPECIES: ATP-binding protein [unclassified Streptomyces]MYW64880.1 ATP-binding protein [Streptomyces sp. SID8379]